MNLTSKAKVVVVATCPLSKGNEMFTRKTTETHLNQFHFPTAFCNVFLLPNTPTKLGEITETRETEGEAPTSTRSVAVIKAVDGAGDVAVCEVESDLDGNFVNDLAEKVDKYYCTLLCQRHLK